jgi:hypothetical protein
VTLKEFIYTMYRAAFVAVLAAGHAAAFAPTMSAFGGLRRQGAAQRLSSATVRAPRRLAAGAPALRAQLGLNDKESSTAVDDFKKDGKVTHSPSQRGYFTLCPPCSRVP